MQEGADRRSDARHYRGRLVRLHGHLDEVSLAVWMLIKHMVNSSVSALVATLSARGGLSSCAKPECRTDGDNVHLYNAPVVSYAAPVAPSEVPTETHMLQRCRGHLWHTLPHPVVHGPLVCKGPRCGWHREGWHCHIFSSC